MTVCRALALVAFFMAVPCAAYAQFGGMPGMPGSPGTPGAPGGGGFGAPRSPPPACQELLTLRDEVQKKANAIQSASKRHAPPATACKLFRTFLSSESKMIKAVDRNGPQCGVPANVPTEMKKGHAHAEKIAKQVCDMAAQGARPPTPSLSDAFGGTPVMPSDNGSKARGGAFDTLTGNALAR
jgi:hypothetical protein